jgi:energy-converting hydrogenase Eha subunit C
MQYVQKRLIQEKQKKSTDLKIIVTGTMKILMEENKMNKIIIICLMLILSLNVVFANDYTTDETITINAEYRIAGVLTESTANITVYLPGGAIDPLADNVSLTEISTGKFTGSYLTSEEGVHTAVVVFYNETSQVGSEVNYFTVEDTTELSVFFYPGLIICAILFLLAFVMRQGLLGILGGIGFIFLGFMLSGAFLIITMASGLLIMLISLFIESD